VDPIVIAIIIVVLVPLAVVWALAKSASLRGPAPRPTSRRPVDTLVTEAVPEERVEEDDEEVGGERSRYQADADSSPPASC
jgi:hypothetical protein